MRWTILGCLVLAGCASGGGEDDAGPVVANASDAGDAGPPSMACASAGCDPLALCDDSSGEPVCSCPAGTTGDGFTCTDVDECATGAAGCDVNATCTNEAGGFSCVCDAGFMGDGMSCVDLDECAAGMDDCDANATCTNTDGGFTCECMAGFTGDGTSCMDVDECASVSAGCDANATCTNTPGGFTCACNMGYAGDGMSCADVDECLAGTAGCDANATCMNTPGAFSCACDAGWMGDGMSCADVDECAGGLDDCDANATCTNTAGSFSCACNMGFMGDGRTCSPTGCPLVDGFEGAGTLWPRSPWIVQAGGGTIVTTPVRTGTYALQDPGWHYRTDRSVGAPGTSLEAWVFSGAGGGRIYLGFGAGAAGARSVVYAPNTNSVIIQQNTSYGFADQSSSPATYATSTWYRLEARFTTGNTVVATVYDMGGATVATTSHTFPSSNVGGVAIRGFGGPTVDDIGACP